MKVHHLQLNLRNSQEIHKLVEATKVLLKEKQTVFIDSKDSKIGDESEERKESKPSSKSEENQESKESSETNSISKEENLKYEDHQEPEVEPKCEIKGQSVENHSNFKTVTYEKNGETSGEDSSSDELEVEQILEIKEDYQEAEYESKAQSVKNYGDSTMGLDKAQAIIGSSRRNDTGGNSTVSKFTHAEVDNTGHKIETEKPLLFELGDKEEFEKSLSLVAIFKKVLTASCKHVVLHMDTKTNAIPSALRFAFDHHFSDIKKTTNYKEFQSSNKSILICSYPAFRGLEYSRITVLIDRDIYFLQHYLVEMLSRCTSELFIVVLQKSSALDYVIEKWKTKELVDQWKTEISKKNNQNKDCQFDCVDEQMIIKGKFKSKYYMQMEEAFKSSRINDNSTSSNWNHEAREIINQR